jgi:hypothetical protein
VAGALFLGLQKSVCWRDKEGKGAEVVNLRLARHRGGDRGGQGSRSRRSPRWASPRRCHSHRPRWCRHRWRDPRG